VSTISGEDQIAVKLSSSPTAKGCNAINVLRRAD
jgi:hypothetical protein